MRSIPYRKTFRELFNSLYGETCPRIQLQESDETLRPGTVFFRAGSEFTFDENEVRLPWSGTEIGPPPADKVKTGRANAERQVVLYVESQSSPKSRSSGPIPLDLRNNP